MTRPALNQIVVGGALLWLLATGCGGHRRNGSAAGRVQAVPFGGAECGACGMVVREQPAPRAQLVYRDGTRLFFCSVGDLVLYMASPSPHGSADAVYVEALDPAADPGHPSKALRPWVDARTAAFVLGIDRGPVMGKPVLAYATKSSAAAVARRYGGAMASFDQVRQRLGGPGAH